MNPNTEFPITGTKGALELKASWKIVAEGEDTSDLFTMTTNVAKLVNRGGKIAIDPSQTETVKVALVGFHIGGVVKGHPEMIWATFEHKDNAPDVAAGTTPETVVSDKDFTFFRALRVNRQPLHYGNARKHHFGTDTPRPAVIHPKPMPSAILSAVVGEDWLAVGDAASSYDAMSSAGITKALMHGQIAGRALATYLRDADTPALAAYQDRVFQDFNTYLGLGAPATIPG